MQLAIHSDTFRDFKNESQHQSFIMLCTMEAVSANFWQNGWALGLRNTKARDFLVKVSSDLIHVRNPWHWPLVDGSFVHSLVEKKSGLLRKFSLAALETPTKSLPLKKWPGRPWRREMLLKNNSSGGIEKNGGAQASQLSPRTCHIALRKELIHLSSRVSSFLFVVLYYRLVGVKLYHLHVSIWK